MYRNIATDNSNKFFSTNITETSLISKALPAGVYKANALKGLGQIMDMEFHKIQKSPYIKVNSGVYKEVQDHLNNFFSQATVDLYKRMSIKHKSNCLLYGPPGTGKSVLLNMIATDVVEQRGAIVLYVEDIQSANFFIQNFNRPKETPLIFICEEFDRLMEYDDDYPDAAPDCSSSILTFLDSPMSEGNMCFMATTNHLNRIPKTVKERPSRFELVVELSHAPVEVINEIVDGIIPSDVATELSIDKAKLKYNLGEADITIDEIKSVCVMHVIHKKSIEEAIKIVLSTTQPA